MKLFISFIVSCLMISFHSVCYSQKFTAGIYNGINFSDIHGQESFGKWRSKPGPVQGLSIGYSFNRSLGLQTGVNISSVYYEHKTYYVPMIYDLDYYPDIGPSFYRYDEKMDFSFLRIPLLFTVTIPSALQFDLRAGLYFSFLQDYSLNYDSYYSVTSKPARKDYGYIFSSGVSYPFSDNFKASLNIGYETGRKRFLENFGYKHGSTEFTLGITYTGFHRNKTGEIIVNSAGDSTRNRITLTFRGGINYSWNSGFGYRNKYSPSSGPSFGFSLDFPVKRGISFQTGLSFERKGYSLKDSSGSFYRYTRNNYKMYYVDSKIQLDYAVIPILINFTAGTNSQIYFNTGPWLGLNLNARTVGVAYDESRTSGSYRLQETVIYDDLEKLITNRDIGWIFGCGASLPLIANYKAEIGMQYSAGFTDIFDKSVPANESSSRGGMNVLKNGTISFLVGLKIPHANHYLNK